MNKHAIKNFAVRARKNLIAAIEHKACEIGITKYRIGEIETFQGGFRVNDRIFQPHEIKAREILVQKIEEKGFDQVIEEVAYTWFNRIAALRFMEINEYLPTGVRVLSSLERKTTEPDIISEALNVDLGIDRDLVYQFLDKNDTEGLYKYLLVIQCNELTKIMPGVFEEISDYTELLVPDLLLAEGSLIKDLVESVDEDEFKDQVEIIGWLYQYFISEKHDHVVGINNGIIKKEDIPAATQLFTPEWIVKYMVQNSLGKFWLNHSPEGTIRESWEFYLDEAAQKPEVQKYLNKLKNEQVNPEEIKFLDPAMGSGHILVYAFDILYEIYISAGYSEGDISKLILENNLYGLDIDDRVSKLAYFALIMRARSKNKGIFKDKLKLNLCSIQESNDLSKESLEWLLRVNQENYENIVQPRDLEYLVDVFTDAKEYGSSLYVDNVNFDAIDNLIAEIKDNDFRDLIENQYKTEVVEKIPHLIKQAKILTQQYHVVVSNPPYMSAFDNKLKTYVNSNFPEFKRDMFSVFVKRNLDFTQPNGYAGFMTPFVWMFIKTYEQMRKFIIQHKTISSLIELEYSGFEEAIVPICTFVLQNAKINFNGTYIKLSEFKGAKNQPVKTIEAVRNPNVSYRYNSLVEDYCKIEGTPIAYWASAKVKDIFQNNIPLNQIADSKQGLSTGMNYIFLKLWFEVNINNIGFNCSDKENALVSGRKWFPCNKGGAFRKWYGNNYYVINWYKNGLDIKNFKGSVIRNENYYFRNGLSWSSLTSSFLSVRNSPMGFIFETKGSVCFPHNQQDSLYLLGYLNSKLVNHLIKMVSPNIDFHEGPMGKLPVIMERNNKIDELVAENIEITKLDWDSFEHSWDFKQHPILTMKGNERRIKEAFRNLVEFKNKQFARLQENEETLNRIFIEIYGLQDELSPDVDENYISISKADREREIKSFISFAVGCMFGRYSLDQKGIAFAGGNFEHEKYKTFTPCKHNVLPIVDDGYFEQDIMIRFIDFLKLTFGEDYLEENLNYIAETLKKKVGETSRQAIRRYFFNNFYKDHVKVYKKRPIYWLFDSGKQNGFKALIYMHRYDPSNVARIRTEYLHKLQKKYYAEINRLDLVLVSNVSQSEKTKVREKKENLIKNIQECMTYEQVIAHAANQKIEIDLDDGVAVNYARFLGIEVPQCEGKKPLKTDLLARI